MRFPHVTSAAKRAWITGAVVATMALGGLGWQSLQGVTASPTGPVGGVTSVAGTRSVAAPKHVTAQVSDKPFTPNAAQLAQREAAMKTIAALKPPSMGIHTTSAQVTGQGGPQVELNGPQVPTDFITLKNSTINSNCSGCGQSAINEPTVANNGRFIVETSNWNIAYSTNGASGTTPWMNQNPYSLSAGFCCDQQVTYDPDRNIFLLLMLDAGSGNVNTTNALDLAIAPGNAPTSWCVYHFDGSTMAGGGVDNLPDFNKIAIGNNFAYVTYNEYGSSGWVQSGLARLPLDDLANCAGFGYSFLNRNDNFTFALSQGPSSLDTYYWVSNWSTNGAFTNGQALRIFSWAENSGSYFAFDRAVNAYTFGNVSCGSPNWCSRLDPRWESVVISRAEFRAQANSAFAGDSILEVATSAGPSGFSNGKNYVVYNYFKLNSLSYIGNDQLYSTSIHLAYPGCAVNQQGHVGCAVAQGANVPGGLLVLQDTVNPTQPWGYQFKNGTNGAGAWGDYIVTSPFNPAVGPFQVVQWIINGSNQVEPHYYVWGRQRETKAYQRYNGH